MWGVQECKLMNCKMISHYGTDYTDCTRVPLPTDFYTGSNKTGASHMEGAMTQPDRQSTPQMHRDKGCNQLASMETEILYAKSVAVNLRMTPLVTQ